MTELSEKVRSLFSEPNYLYVGTINSDGSPQVTPVWTDVEDSRIRFNTAVGRVKERNLRRDPRVGMSIAHRENPWDKVDIRGRVVEFVEGDEADRHIDELSAKYTGQTPYPWRTPDERRVIVLVEPERVYEM
ncbi:MAG: PPOX class F420-dependent oxidoreductase [Actinomycetota bacterium]|jgi:PPOX class probable F420-dependent enzyme|nr:PPOX class F420-dependent oxidoreductase [Actinomycetota bacterium]